MGCIERVLERAAPSLHRFKSHLVFVVIALVIFNLFPQWVGLNYWASVDGASSRWFSRIATNSISGVMMPRRA